MKNHRNKRPPSWLKQRLDELYYLRKYGWAQRRSKITKSWRSLRSSLRRWRESRPIAKKIRENERKKNARKLNRSIAKAPRKAGEKFHRIFLYWVKFPGKFLKSCRSTIKKLRKLSLREILLECWKLYLASIGYFLQLPRTILKWWKKQKVWLRIVSGSFASLFILCLIASPLIFREAKLWRAEDLFEQSKVLKENNQIQLAYEKSRVAAMLAPENQEHLEQTMELADQLHNPSTLWWSERITQNNLDDADILARMIEQSLDYGQVATGSRYMSLMRSRFPDSKDVIGTELELMMRQGMREEALIKANTLVNRGTDSPMAYSVFAELALNTTDDDIYQKAQDLILVRSQQPDAIGLALCKLAQRLPTEQRMEMNLDQETFRELILTNPEATRADRIEATGFATLFGNLPEQEAFDAIISEYNVNDPTELKEALETLSRFKIYVGRNELISENQIFTLPEFALAYVEWLVLSSEGNLEEADKLLDGKEERPLPISEAKRRFWQAIIAYERNQLEEFSVFLLKSLDSSTRREWDYMHQILVKHTTTRQQHAFYRELFGRPESPVIAAERYMSLTYELGIDEELQILLKQLQPERFQNKPDSLNFLLYLQTLQGRNLPVTRARLEKLIGQYPKAVLYYRTLAFVYAKCGEVSLARAIYSEIPAPPNDSPPFIRLMHAYVTGDLSNLPTSSELHTKEEKALMQAMTVETPSL